MASASSASASSNAAKSKPLVRRLSFFVSLVISVGLIGSATSCAQIIGVNKDYKKGSFAPSTWFCENKTFYDEIGNGVAPEDAVCDCACGAYDPDCDDPDVGSVSDHGEEADEPNGIPDSAACRVCNYEETAKGDNGVCASQLIRRRGRTGGAPRTKIAGASASTPASPVLTAAPPGRISAARDRSFCPTSAG